MKKANRLYIAAGLCLLAYFINELGLLIGNFRMWHLLVSDARLSMQALEAANLNFVPTLISSSVRGLVYLLLVLYCFCLNQRKAGGWLFALAFLLEAARCGRLFVESIGHGFASLDVACFVLMLLFCLSMTLLKPVKSKHLWQAGGVALGLCLLLTIAEEAVGVITLLRSEVSVSFPWWVQLGNWGLLLCRIAGFALLWQQEKPAPTEPTPE